MKIEIAKSQNPADAPSILALIKAKAAFDGDVSGLELTLVDLERDFYGSSKKAEVLTARVDGSIVGIATYDYVYSTFKACKSIWLDDLYVDSEFRSHGIGLLLLTELARQAKAAGCKRIDWIVATDNEMGQAFYKRHGAKIIDNVYLARLDDEKIADLA